MREIACSFIIQNNSLRIVQCLVVKVYRHIESPKLLLIEIAYRIFMEAHYSENFFYVGLIYHWRVGSDLLNKSKSFL